MTTLRQVAEQVLANIYADNRVNTVEYSELDALNELKGSIEWRIKQLESDLEDLKNECELNALENQTYEG